MISIDALAVGFTHRSCGVRTVYPLALILSSTRELSCQIQDETESFFKVQEPKPLIRSKLIEIAQAIVYGEPEKRVMSRSGDEYVVALTDQWYIIYEEPEWKKLTEACLPNMNLYSDETRHGFEHTLSWLNQWACSHSFRFGTRFPWDEEFLVESLSDSTIYMAYYLVAHILQNGAFEINDDEVFIITQRAALNLAYQNFSKVPEKPTCLVELTGYDLIGLPLKSPLSFNEIIYSLPMLSILTSKGTGIVTSVPSDAPDDYMAMHGPTIL